MKTAERWNDPEAHVRLKQLYTERVKGITQAEFGAEHGIGTQGMVWQYLNGHTPLSLEAAARFARGLQCTIADISPSMAKALEAEILPVMGARALKRATAKVAMLLIATLLTIPPTPAQAARTSFNIIADGICIVFL